MKEPVKFYGSRWWVFDNFSAVSIEWHGKVWPTSEHAYQAAKFFHLSSTGIVEEILSAHTPLEAKEIAHGNEKYVALDWGSRKTSVMESILRAKLEQHTYVRESLIETEDREIIENSPIDKFWGQHEERNPDGQNMLGRLWMKLRDEINSSASTN